MKNVEVISKARGALLASAIGDALGWPYELNSNNQNIVKNPENVFVSWKRRCKNPFWHVEMIKKGEYSDDTQLLLAVARSLLTEDWKRHFTSVEYPFWLKYERGGGKAVKKAAGLWKKGKLPWIESTFIKDYFRAGGNGGAMRILPHAIQMNGKELSELMDAIFSDVTFSHGHPRAILGATCYAYALNYLLGNQNSLAYAELVDVLIKGRLVWGCPIESFIQIGYLLHKINRDMIILTNGINVIGQWLII